MVEADAKNGSEIIAKRVEKCDETRMPRRASGIIPETYRYSRSSSVFVEHRLSLRLTLTESDSLTDDDRMHSIRKSLNANLFTEKLIRDSLRVRLRLLITYYG